MVPLELIGAMCSSTVEGGGADILILLLIVHLG